MFVPFAPLVLGTGLVVAVVDSVPTIDIRNTCRQAAVVTAGPSAQSDIDICMSSEDKAREQLVRDWNQYALADRVYCVQAGAKVYLPSYVEWLTCLEMETTVKKIKREQQEAPTR